MKKTVYRKEVLGNGIRVVTEQVPFVKSVSLGIWVEVGSRDEKKEEAGLSHFLEHMLFKGTERRSAQDIAREIDGLGGELNAFTSREGTTFYAKVADEHAGRAVNLLGDLFRNSVFKKSEIDREKQVVLEEIKMVEDDPEDLVHELHTKNIWQGHPIGHSILGDSKSVQSISKRKLKDFISRKYLPERIVISAAGRFNRPELIRRIRRVFGSFGKNGGGAGISEPRMVPSTNGFRFAVQKKKLEQAHLCLGLPGLPLAHRDRYGAYALNTLLGGGMSSRLFQEIREKRGLVYSIYSSLSGFKDTGLLTIYAASSPKIIRKVIKLTVDELRRIRKGGVTREELKRALNQLKGNILLGLESTNSRMNRLAREEIYFGRTFSMEEVISEIDKVSRKQIQDLAEELLDPSRLSITVLGPVSIKPSQLESLAG